MSFFAASVRICGRAMLRSSAFDGYSTSLDMASALHPQTILAIDFEDPPLTPEWGAPVRLRIPTKLGFKSAKNLKAIEVTNILSGRLLGGPGLAIVST